MSAPSSRHGRPLRKKLRINKTHPNYVLFTDPLYQVLPPFGSSITNRVCLLVFLYSSKMYVCARLLKPVCSSVYLSVHLPVGLSVREDIHAAVIASRCRTAATHWFVRLSADLVPRTRSSLVLQVSLVKCLYRRLVPAFLRSIVTCCSGSSLSHRSQVLFGAAGPCTSVKFLFRVGNVYWNLFYWNAGVMLGILGQASAARVHYFSQSG